MRRVFVVLALLACHKEVKQQTVVDTTTTDTRAVTTDADTTKTVAQAPTVIDTKVIRTDVALVVKLVDGSVSIVDTKPGQVVNLPKGALVTGTVPLDTSVTEQDKHVGETTTTEQAVVKKAEADASNTHTKAKSKLQTVMNAGPGFRFYAFLLLALVIVMVAGYFYLKFIRKVAWL